jgi:hypothetical protein
MTKPKKYLELRENQNKSIDQTVRAITSGRDMLVSKPTGSGKGVEILALVARLAPLGWRILITAPQINILGNFLNKGDGTWTHIKSGNQITVIGDSLVQEKIDARDIGRYLNSGEGYALAMTQQALVAYTKRKRLPNLNKCLLIADEFHHSAADGFETVINEWKNQGGLVAGYTATPWRTDGRQVGWLDDNMSAYYLSLAEHMQSGYCPSTLHSEFVGYQTEEVTDDNFSGNILTEMEAESIAETVYTKWINDKKPKFVLYYQSSTVQRNQQVREAILQTFKNAGEQVLDSTGEEGGELFNIELATERKLSHKESKYAGIVGCGRVREGMDWPHCAAVYVIGMPTSTNLLVQLFGRACRKKGDDYKPKAYKDIAEISFFLPQTHGNTFEHISQIHSWNTLAVCFFLTDSSLGQRSIPIRRIGSGLRKGIKDHNLAQELDEEITKLAIADDSTYAGKSIENEVVLQVVDLAEQGLHLNEIAEHLCNQGYDAEVVNNAIVQQGMIEHPETGDFIEKEAKKAYRRASIATKISVPKIRKEVFEAYVQEFRTLTLKGSTYAKGVAKQLHSVGGVKALVERLQEGQGTPATDEQILRWAENYFEREGKAPTKTSGRVGEYDSMDLTWNAVEHKLRGRQSSLFLFCVSQGFHAPVDIDDTTIFNWAERYESKNGRLPTAKSEFIGEAGSGDLRWSGLNERLTARGSSLSQVLVAFGMRPSKKVEDDDILVWVRSYLNKNGSTPTQKSGAIGEPDSGVLTWEHINTKLKRKGSSLFQFLYGNGLGQVKASDEQILRWVKNYVERKGKPPSTISGSIEERDSGTLTWVALDGRLRARGASLSKFCAEYGIRSTPCDVTEEQVLRWAKKYTIAHGKPPSDKSGLIGETDSGSLHWAGLSARLRTEGSSLSNFCVRHGLREPRVNATEEQTLRWIRSFTQLKNKPPLVTSGLIREHDSGGLKWHNLDQKLRKQGSSLSQFCKKHGLK